MYHQCASLFFVLLCIGGASAQSDQDKAIERLRKLGAKVESRKDNTLIVEFTDPRYVNPPPDLVLRVMTEIARLKKISILRLYDARIGDKEFSVIGAQKDLIELSLVYTSITDESAVHIASFPKVKVLSLGFTQITDSGLKRIADKQKNVETLSLNSAKRITNDGMRCLTGIEGLSDLDIENCNITDKGVKSLSGCKGLKSLNISATKITGIGFSAFSEMPKLERLVAATSEFNDEGLAALEHCTSLSTLYLGATRITDGGLKSLGRLPKLKVVNLVRCGIAGEGFSNVHLSSLISINCAETSFSDKGVKELASKNKAIEVLILSGTEVTDKSLSDIALFDSLVHLSIDSTSITLRSFEKCMAHLKNIQRVVVSRAMAQEADLERLRKEFKKTNFIVTN